MNNFARSPARALAGLFLAVAVARAGQLQEDGDMAGASVWHRILNAIERLQATKPAEGEPHH